MRDAGRAACTTEINVSACPIRLRERESFGAFLYDFVALSGRSFPVSYSVRTVDFPSLRAWPRFRYDFYGIEHDQFVIVLQRALQRFVAVRDMAHLVTLVFEFELHKPRYLHFVFNYKNFLYLLRTAVSRRLRHCA